MISVMRIFATVDAHLSDVGKASTHPEKVSAITRRHFVNWQHVSKIILPFSPWEDSPCLVGWEGRGPDIGLGVSFDAGLAILSEGV